MPTDKAGQHFAEYGMAGSPTRKDYEDLRYMEKRMQDKNESDLKSQSAKGLEMSRKYEKPVTRKRVARKSG